VVREHEDGREDEVKEEGNGKGGQDVAPGLRQAGQEGEEPGHAAAEDAEGPVDDHTENAPQQQLGQQAEALEVVGLALHAPGEDLSASGEQGEFKEGQQQRGGGVGGDVGRARGGQGEKGGNRQGEQDGNEVADQHKGSREGDESYYTGFEVSGLFVIEILNNNPESGSSIADLCKEKQVFEIRITFCKGYEIFCYTGYVNGGVINGF
jgi:hypothetical protein